MSDQNATQAAPKQIVLTLEENEVIGLIQVLGDLPTKTGAFILMTKIQQQAQQQLPQSQG